MMCLHILEIDSKIIKIESYATYSVYYDCIKQNECNFKELKKRKNESDKDKET